MKIREYLLILVLLFSLLGCIHTTTGVIPSKPGDTTEDIYEEIMPNGLKVIALKDPHAVLAVFQIWYHAGSMNEQVGKTGLSHLLEHMMFKGTPRYGAKEFSRIIKRAGGIDNAGTGKDYAFYYQKLSPERINLSIELEADRMQHLLMNEEEALLERDVVMEERRMRYEDDPEGLLYEEVVSTAFKNHPYRSPVIGWMSDLQRLSLDDLWRYYRTYYTPNNAVIIVAGDIDVDGIMKSIRSRFGSIHKGPPVSYLEPGEPEQRGERRVYVKKEAEVPYILIAYKAPNILEEDSYALEVLASILSDGKSSRIYRALVDEGRLALSAGTWYDDIRKYPFLFFLHGSPLPGRTVEKLEEALYVEVAKITEEPPTEREVQKVKNQIEADFIMQQDSIFSRAVLLGRFEMIGDWRLMNTYLDGIRDVQPSDVQRVAAKYLVADNRTVGILIPVEEDRNE